MCVCVCVCVAAAVAGVRVCGHVGCIWVVWCGVWVLCVVWGGGGEYTQPGCTVSRASAARRRTHHSASPPPLPLQALPVQADPDRKAIAALPVGVRELGQTVRVVRLCPVGAPGSGGLDRVVRRRLRQLPAVADFESRLVAAQCNQTCVAFKARCPTGVDSASWPLPFETGTHRSRLHATSEAELVVSSQNRVLQSTSNYAILNTGSHRT